MRSNICTIIYIFFIKLGIEIAGTLGKFNNILIHAPWKYLLVLELKVPQPMFDPVIQAIQNGDHRKSIDRNAVCRWFDDPRTVLAQKHLVKSFADFVSINYDKENKDQDADRVRFAVTLAPQHSDDAKGANANKEVGPANIKLYSKAGEEDSNVEIPSRPRNIKITSVGDTKLKVTVTWEPVHLEKSADTEKAVHVPRPLEEKEEDTEKETEEAVKKPEPTYTITVVKNERELHKKITREPKHEFEVPAAQAGRKIKYTISVQTNFVANNLADDDDSDDENQKEFSPYPIIGQSAKKTKLTEF